MNKKSNVRDCVKQALEVGAKDKYEFRHMRYGITCELKRVGYDEEEIKWFLAEWNDKSYRPLNWKEFKQQVEKFVDWVFKKEGKAGCKYFKDFCLDKCMFREKRRRDFNKQAMQEPPVSQDDIEKYLREEESIKNPRDCSIIWKIIDIHRIKNFLPRESIVYIGQKVLSRLMGEWGYIHAYPMFVCRRIKELADTPLLEIVEKGKKGNFTGMSNGYRLRIPDEVMVDEQSICT